VTLFLIHIPVSGRGWRADRSHSVRNGLCSVEPVVE
jgi:hypothetical protein